MPTRDLLRAVTQWTPGIKPTWTIAEVRRALRLHAEGDFSLSAQLVDAMGEDDEIPGALEKWCDSILGSNFALEAVDKPNKQLSKRIVSEFEPFWWKMYPEGDLDEWLRWYRMLGVGIAVHDKWERTGSRWIPRLKVLHPQFLRYEQFTDRWLYYAQEGELEVIEGDGKWLKLMDGQRGWMKGAVRALAVAWVSKQLTIRDWNRYNERHGLPLLKAKAPMIADEGDRDEFFEDLQGLKSETIALLLTHVDGQSKDAAYDLDLLEAKDQSYESFEKHLQRQDRKFQVYLIGGNLSSEVVDQGARSAADTHRGVERTKAAAGANKLSTDLREQGLFPVVQYNIEGVTLEIVPWPKWDTDPPEDEKAEAEADEAFAKELKAFDEAGYEVENAVELADKRGIKLKKKEPLELPAPPTGDGKPPVPGATPPVPPKPAGNGNTARLARLASGFLASKASGFLNGQIYADKLTDEATDDGQQALEPTFDAILEELEAASDYEDLRKRLQNRYETLNADQLAELVYRAMVMADFAGRAAVQEDS
jgi:plasmid maintenance system killer protein